jgi:hypothetical protein
LSNDPSPEAEKALRKFFGVFIGTLFLYVSIYGGCQAYRVRSGAWRLTFDLQPDGTPQLRIDHPRILKEGPLALSFPGEVAPRVTNGPITWVYTRPDTNTTPFGPIVFLDNTQLPGTISINAFGHAVEMVPRTLFVDFQEIPWTSGTNVVLKADTKPDPERMKPRNQQWNGR